MSHFFSKIFQAIKKINPNFLLLGTYLFLSILAFRGVMFNSETIGFRHDWAIAETPAELRLWFQHAFHAWIDARGGFSISYLSDYLLRILLGSLSYLNIGGNIISKIILVFFVVFSGWLSAKYFYRQINNYSASFFASLIYVFNPLTFNKIISGHVNYLLAYALAPLFLLCFLNFQTTPISKRSQMFFWLIASGLVLAFLGIQIQFPILIVFLIIILNFLFPQSWKKTFLGLIFCGLIAFLIHLPWLIVLFLEIAYFKNSTSATPTLFSWFVHNSSHLYQAMMLTGGGTDYLTQTLINNSFYAPFLGIFGLILIIIILFVLIIKPRPIDSLLFFFFLLMVFILSSTKIFPNLAFWLINTSFIFSVFREIYHLTFLAGFCFALLVGLTIVKINYWRQQTKILYLFFICLLLYALPFFFDGKLLNNLQSFSLSRDYIQYFSSSSRQLFLPSLQPLQINNKEYGGFDLSVYYSPNSSISELGYFSSMSDRFATFFQSQLYFNSSQLAGVFPKYLDLLNIKQIVYRNNINSIHDKFTRLAEYPTIKKYFNNHSLLNVLEPYKSKITKQTTDWQIYEFADTDKISVISPCQTTGAWNDFNQLFLLTGPASCNGVFLTKDQNKNSLSLSSINLFFANNNITDLYLQKPGVKYYESGTFANQSNDPKSDWVSSEHVWWYDPAFAGYSKLLSFTSAKDAKLKTNLKSLPKGQYRLFIEIYQQPDGGDLGFKYQTWQKKINTQALTKHFVWTDLGEINIVDSNPILNISNINGSNAVGLILFLPVDQFDGQKSNNLLIPDEQPIGLLNDFSQTGEPAFRDFDLSKDYQTYQNFSDISNYDFNFSSQEITVTATFNGDANQNEFATIIYPLDCDPLITPNIAFNTDLDQKEIGFWEMGLEVDTNQDGLADNIIWDRLKNNFNYINIADFLSQTDQNIDLSSLKIISFRLQPHKEYSVDMNKQVEKQVIFTFSNLKFYTSANLLARLPRTSSQIDLKKLTSVPSEKIKLNDKVSLFNPFPDTTKQEMNTEENKIIVTSSFSSKNEAAEFSTVIIDTNIDLATYPYATIDLSVSHPDLQFFDLAWDIDSDYDNLVDQKIWVKSVNFTKDQSTTTQFSDILNLLQTKTYTYQHPRVLAVEILPHKQYDLKVDSMPSVSFSISNLNFYHEAALQSSQINPFSTLHNEIDVPKSGEYDLYLNVSSQNSGNIDVSLADQSFKVNIGQDLSRQWVKVGHLSLVEKKYDLTLITYDQNFIINNSALFNKYFGQQSTAISENKISDFQKLSSTQYQSDIHLQQPAYILFKESYHPAWQLKVYDSNNNLKETLRPVIINGWQQAYFMENTGDFHLRFEYSLDPIYRKLLIFSLLFLFCSLLALLILKYIARRSYSR